MAPLSVVSHAESGERILSWFKLDDRFFDNPKIIPLSDKAKLAYLQAGVYCARELTNGLIPLKRAHEYAGRAAVVKELVPHLWEPVEGGYYVHDYLKYNPTKEKVLAEREAARRRMFGLRSGEHQENFNGTSAAPVPGISS